MKFVIGTKKGMTRVFEGDKSVGVTIVDTEGCVVTRKTSDGIELGIGKKRANKAAQGQYKEVGFVPRFKAWFNGEFADLKVGDSVDLSQMVSGAVVKVNSRSKGKGFAGVVKRHGFAGGPKTHGQSDRHRAPGSIGAGTDPGRVLKGKRMAGRMGGDSVTVKKRVVDVKGNFVLIAGGIAGNRGDLVKIELA